jgi:amidase
VGFGIADEVVYRPAEGRLLFLEELETPVEPSIGCMGVAPASESEATPNDACGPHGGNLNCRDAAPGAFVFFRVRAPGAKIGLGNVHLAVGDGEIGGQGVHGAADALIQAFPVKPAGVEWPWILNQEWLMTLGGHADLASAQEIAYESMLQLANDLFGLDRARVNARIAAAGYLKVCQACRSLVTVRVCVPLGLFDRMQSDLLNEIRIG